MKTRILCTLAMAIPSLLFGDCAPTGLVAMWKGQSNALDSVGGYNGTNGTGVTYVNAEVGTGFSFNGTSAAKLDLGSFLNFGMSDFTVEFWIKTTTTDPYRRAELIGKRSACAHSRFFDVQLQTNGTICFNYDGDPNGFGMNGFGYIDMASATAVNDGAFHHVACVRKGTNALIYIDGSLSATQIPADGRVANISNTNHLFADAGGPCAGGSYAYFTGVLDEISIYTKALEASNILAIAQDGTNGKCCWLPNIVTQPVTQGVPTNSSAIFTVTAQGSPSPSFQWQQDGADIIGATDSAYTISSAQDTDAGTYTVILSNSCGTVTSDGTSVLTFGPVITNAPLSQAVLLGTNISISVNPTGNPPFSFDWFFSGQDGVGFNGNGVATSNVFTIPYFTLSDVGSYTVIAENADDWYEVDFVLTADSSSIATADSGLLAWWQGEFNGLDHAGGNNGTVKSTVAYTNGEVGTAFFFNGTTNSAITVGTTFGNFKTNDFTISMWVQMEDYHTGDLGHDSGVLIEKETLNAWYGNNPMWEFGISGGSPYFIHQGNTTYGGTATSDFDDLTANSQIDDGVWHHVAFVRSGLTNLLYVDGQLDISDVTWDDYPLNVNNTGTFRIAQDIQGGNQTGDFWGSMDEIAIHDHALTSNEIAGLFMAGTFGIGCADVNITTAPASPQKMQIGSNAVFTVTSLGTGLYYQWNHNGSPLANGTTTWGSTVSGAYSSALTISRLTNNDLGTYDVYVNNYCGEDVREAYLDFAPIITAQPTNCIAFIGQAYTNFTVAATGSSLTYRWLDNTATIQANFAKYGSSTNTTSLTISNIAGTDADTYSVVISNHGGTVTSAGKTLSTPPQVTGPNSVTNDCHTTATLTLTVTGTTNKLSYRWESNSVAHPTNFIPMGVTTKNLTIASTNVDSSLSDIGFRVVVTNSISTNYASSGIVTSAVAYVRVRATSATPVASYGNICDVTNWVTLSESPCTSDTMSYQWRRNGTAIAGATASWFTTNSAGTYSVVITNQWGNDTSAGSVLKAVTSPTITLAPQSQTVVLGNSAYFTGSATG
ncbi:MAG: LamG-like jellyroll fold domain-containing protein, partial [Limisphaerales bacterium]